MMDLISNLKTNKKKLAVVILGVVVFIAFDYLVIIQAQLNQIKGIESRAAKANNDIKNVLQDLEKVRQMQKGQAVNSQGVRSPLKRLVSDDEISLLIRDISNFADASNVKVIQIKPVRETSSSKTQTSVTPLKITMDLMCGYHALGAFLNRLEGMEQFLEAQEIRIVPSNSDYFSGPKEIA